MVRRRASSPCATTAQSGSASRAAGSADNPERLGTRASFVAPSGVAPIPASSGQRTRHRLSRGGNRHANAVTLGEADR
ncbi:transposase [Humibacter antri]